MKKIILFALAVLTTQAFAAPVEITCGDMQKGNSVAFLISPLLRAVEVKTYLDGALTLNPLYRPTNGVYDTAELTFSGREFLETSLSIHGSYAQYLRLSHYASFSIVLKKSDESGNYLLTNYSTGSFSRTGHKGKLEETSHPEYIGLLCNISGL